MVLVMLTLRIGVKGRFLIAAVDAYPRCGPGLRHQRDAEQHQAQKPIFTGAEHADIRPPAGDKFKQPRLILRNKPCSAGQHAAVRIAEQLARFFFSPLEIDWTQT